MRNFLPIFLIGLVLAGCRSQREVKTQQTRARLDEIGVELHRLENLWSSLAEQMKIHIEYYPPYEDLSQGPENKPDTAAPSLAMSADSTHISSPLSGGRSGFGGMGAVKSIDISTERKATTTTSSAVDSTAVFKTEQEETLQKEKASETRQDNGTVAIVAVVAAVALLIYLLLKQFLKP